MRTHLIGNHTHSVRVSLIRGWSYSLAVVHGKPGFRRRVPVVVDVSHSLQVQSSSAIITNKYVILLTALNLVNKDEVSRTGLKAP